MEQELLQQPFDGRVPQRREGAHPVGHLGEGAPHLGGYETSVWEVGATLVTELRHSAVRSPRAYGLLSANIP